MPAWLETFLVVTAASRRLRIALYSVVLVPFFVLLVGTFQANGTVPAGPYMPLVAAVREATFPLYLAIAAIGCIACVKVAANEYRSVRRRLFGD
jgi:hypothetical protein